MRCPSGAPFPFFAMESEPVERQPWPRWIVVSVVVAAAAVTVLLLALGSIGADVAQVLALTTTLLTGPLSLWSVGSRLRPGRTRNPRRKLVIIGGAAVCGVGAATAFWFFGGQADLNVTGDTVLSRSTGLADGDRVELVGNGSVHPFDPPRRDNAMIRFSLRNQDETGYCVGPAVVEFVLAVDGEPPDFAHPVRKARSGDEVDLDLSTATRVAAVHARVTMPDKACRVHFQLDRVLLYN